MKALHSIHLITALTLAVAFASCGNSGTADVQGNGYPYSQVPFTAVRIDTTTFLGQRVEAARNVTVPLAFSKCQSEGRYDNFVKAAHPSAEYDVSSFMGYPFDDTDVYKTIEGASYILQTYPDEKLEAYLDSIIDIIGAAQEPDGYLYTARTINPAKPHEWSGPERWSKVEELSHELYDLGHMVDAACAHYQATGITKFLDIARRYADCVIREVGPGEGQHHVVPGHQIAEMALARLYLVTGEKKYLDEAKYFLDYRGKTSIHDIYSQSDKPILEQTEAWGHAVRAGYMYSGIADVAALTGDTAYINTIDRIWENIVGRKYYLTGGVGARHEGEAFGADYELPNLTAYNETCAAIAQVYLNQRMFMLHGDSKYIDCLERTLYNGVISGMSVDGGRFFYPNPLQSDAHYAFNADNTLTRQPWFGCACCPSNLCRFIPSLPGYLYGVRGSDIYCNLFAGNTATISLADGTTLELTEKTAYPWNGDISITVDGGSASNANMLVRIPGWAQGRPVPSDLYAYTDSKPAAWSVRLNGSDVESNPADNDGYVRIDGVKAGDVISIHFDMPVRTVLANRQVQDDRGLIAVERGPLVYCAEDKDNAGTHILEAAISPDAEFTVDNNWKIRNIESLIGTPQEGQADAAPIFTVTALQTDGLTLIPYYSWGHRGAAEMTVWLKEE